MRVSAAPSRPRHGPVRANPRAAGRWPALSGVLSSRRPIEPQGPVLNIALAYPRGQTFPYNDGDLWLLHRQSRRALANKTTAAARNV
jgi:hypothetical protein